MNAVISGRAATAVIIDGDMMWMIRAAAPKHRVPIQPQQFPFILGDQRDLQFIEGSEEAEIEERLLAARDLEHALLFTLMLLDADLTTATRSRAAEDLEPLITPPSPREREPWVRYKAIGQCLRGILFAHPLPETADVAQALQLCDSLHLSWTRGLLLNIRDSQADIREICNAWDSIPNEIFDTEQSERARFRAVAVREGLFHDLAFTTVRERTDSFVSDRLKIPAIAAFKNSRGILERWVAPLYPRSAEPAPEESPPSISQRPHVHLTGVKNQIDIGILTIRNDEFAAVLDRFPNRQTIHGRRFYNYSRVATKAGTELAVAATCLPRQGQISAHVVANDIIADLNPPWLFLVGIGGGIPNDEYSLGDVVVANRLNDFCVSAWLQNKPPDFSIVGGLMHKEVEALLANLIAFKELGGWNNQQSLRMKKPDVEVPDDLNSPVYYGSEEWRKAIQSSLRQNFPKGKRRRPPKVRTAPVSSSDALIKNADLAEQWQKSARHTEAVEMELAGVYAAAHYAGDYRVVAIRGLSDIVGFKRSGDWTAFACNSAAAFAIALIRSGIIGSRINPDSSMGGVLSSFSTWNTGDFQIDQQLRKLQHYDPTRDPGSVQLIRLIRPLFARAAFLPQQEGDWLTFAYVVSATRMLIQQCLNVVDDDGLRVKLRDVIKEIAALEEIAQKVLGHGVRLSAHAERFIHDKNQYVSQLAALTGWEHAYTDPKRLKTIYKGNGERVRLITRLEEKIKIAGLL